MNKNIDERIKKLIDAIARSIMNMIKYDQLGYFEGRQQIKTKEIIIDIFQIQKATLLTIKQKLQAFDPNKVYIKGVKQEFDPARNIMKNLYKVIKDLESNPYILGFYMNMMFLFKILRIYYFHQGTKSKNVLRMNLKGHMDNNILNVIKDQITQGVCYKSTNEEYNKTGKVRQTVEIKKPSNSVQAIGRSLYPQKGNKLEGTNITEKLVETNNTEKLVGTNNTEKLVETKNTKIKNLICEHQPTCNRNFTNFIEGNHATFGHAPACDHMDYIIKTILKDYFSIYDSKKGQFSYWFSFEYTKHLQVLYYLYHYRIDGKLRPMYSWIKQNPGQNMDKYTTAELNETYDYLDRKSYKDLRKLMYYWQEEVEKVKGNNPTERVAQYNKNSWVIFLKNQQQKPSDNYYRDLLYYKNFTLHKNTTKFKMYQPKMREYLKEI